MVKLVNYTNENKTTYDVIAEITTNHSMSIDDAINLVGEIFPEKEEENVLIDGKWFYYDDIDTIWE